MDIPQFEEPNNAHRKEANVCKDERLQRIFTIRFFV